MAKLIREDGGGYRQVRRTEAQHSSRVLPGGAFVIGYATRRFASDPIEDDRPTAATAPRAAFLFVKSSYSFP
jgi:hypothetical protein